MSFYTIDNMKLLVSMFKDLMNNKYSIAIDDDPQTRKLIYDIMKGVNRDFQGPFQMLNIKVLEIARDIYLKKMKQTQVQNLVREKAVFGDREMKTSVIVPEIDPYTKKNNYNNDTIIERMSADRDKELGIDRDKYANINVNELIKSTKEIPEQSDDFMKKLKELESQRNVLLEDIEHKRPKNKEEENALHEDLFKIAEPKKSMYMVVNSHQRNWISKPSRYQYFINIPKITNLSLTHAIIPFTNDKIYPYLLLKIEEIHEDYYINSKKTFCKLLFDKQVTTSNGRIQWTMKPLHNIVYSHPLNHMNITICKPDEEILDTLDDTIAIQKIDFEKNELLRITCGRFFTKEEFNINDNIVIKSLDEDSKIMKTLFEPSGFDIIKLGPYNQYGCTNIFYINLPGKIDKVSGTYKVHPDVYNYVNGNIIKNTFIINMSLQHTLSFNVEYLAAI